MSAANPLPILEPAATLPGSSPDAERQPTYAFVSLGCPKNLVDSERMLGKLALDGYALVSEPDGADFVVVNTCGFIEDSRKESKAVVREMLELKAAGRTGGVVLAGCLAEREGATLLEEMPDLDHIVGVHAREEITSVAERIRSGMSEQRELFRPAPIISQEDTERLRLTPGHFAYLKISEGCDRTCTFCSIPSMRGKHVTKPIDQCVAEARELAADGVRELILVAQDTTYYGMDLYGEVRLAALLRALRQVEGIDWIRLMYLYPVNFTDELIDTIGDGMMDGQGAQILPYLDMPLQHINSRVLKRMQRRVNRERTIELVGQLRERLPNLVLRTTFVVGFPGETEAQFEELRDFVRDTRFERLGVFPYSPEPGTPAMKLDGHLPESVRQGRAETLLADQQPIAFAFGDSLVDFELDCLIDQSSENGTAIGRLYSDAPEIDGVVYVAADGLEAGQIVPVTLDARRDYDWIGSLSDDEGDT